MLAMLLFCILSVAASALAGVLSASEVAPVRFIAVGAVAGAMIWSYLTATWPLTARASATVTPQMSESNAALIGAIGGLLGGIVLFAIDAIRGRMRNC